MRTPASGIPALLALLLLSACATTGKDTIAALRSTRIEIREEKIDDAREKAIESYRRFLEQTPDSALKPEAIRRLADLKAEKEYAALSDNAPEKKPDPGAATAKAGDGDAPGDRPVQGVDEREPAGPREAIELYKKLLNDYPSNDQVLYQLSRAYEELGQIEEAMEVMARLVLEYPRSRYIDEVQFRRAEYFFTRRRYPDAAEAYGSIVTMGPSSSYYQLALYKLGWTFYKQELYEEALDRFIALLDYKVSTGYDFARSRDDEERKRVDDTFRVISLSFSNLGGANSVVDYFDRKGKCEYEDRVYGNLAEFYFEKRRYSDAAAAYTAFITRNPFHKVSPQFQMRVIEIHLAGGFSRLVIEAKKQFIEKYGLKAAYWRHFEPGSRPEVLAWLKTNLNDLAGHYHALYQSSNEMQEKRINFAQAAYWYREFLASFPADPDTPAVNYMLADLYLENGFSDRAAAEYEKTAYDYPRHEKSAQAGYAAVYAWRQYLAGVGADAKTEVMKEVASSSINFAVTYPEHEKAAIVLGAAADDLYDMKEYEPAATVARRLIDGFPGAGPELLRAAWLVAGHASYELARYAEAETAYERLLELMPPGDQSRAARIENLAAAIYKQGEQANAREDYQEAAQHFLRVGRLAPMSKIRANAEYDAAAALMQCKDWKTAAGVLAGFRNLFPGHALQPEVTRKIAYAYREDGQFSLAADEYERMERESKDDEVRREALLAAAELHEKAGNQDRMLAVCRRYQDSFPRPIEPNLETRDRIAEVLKKKNDQDGYLAELGQIVAIDAAAAGERTPRTRALASKAGLVLAEQTFNEFVKVKLVEPFEANLGRKKELMKVATQQFNQLVDYEVGDVTAAATFYLAEMYADFSKDLKESERPAGLSALEREEYDLAIEEQAYPFEEKAIATHKSNLELISRGVYDEWIEKSLQKLAAFVPARYDKPEEESAVIASPDSYVFVIEGTKPAAPKAAEGVAPQAGEAKWAAKQGDAVAK
jgi:tetratricopeptide (TPR) repeat protein